MPKRKAVVSTEWNLLDLIDDPLFVADGYLMPTRTFPAHAKYQDGTVVDITVELVEKGPDDWRAIARTLTVESERGVSSAFLRKVEVRNIVATACLDQLRPFELTKDGFRLLDHADPAKVRAIIRALVGYVDVEVPS